MWNSTLWGLFTNRKYKEYHETEISNPEWMVINPEAMKYNKWSQIRLWGFKTWHKPEAKDTDKTTTLSAGEVWRKSENHWKERWHCAGFSNLLRSRVCLTSRCRLSTSTKGLYLKQNMLSFSRHFSFLESNRSTFWIILLSLTPLHPKELNPSYRL